MTTTLTAPAILHVGVPDSARMLEADVEHGLSPEELLRRQQKFGPNRVVTRRESSGWKRFLPILMEPTKRE